MQSLQIVQPVYKTSLIFIVLYCIYMYEFRTHAYIYIYRFGCLCVQNKYVDIYNYAYFIYNYTYNRANGISYLFVNSSTWWILNYLAYFTFMVIKIYTGYKVYLIILSYLLIDLLMFSLTVEVINKLLHWNSLTIVLYPDHDDFEVIKIFQHLGTI